MGVILIMKKVCKGKQGLWVWVCGTVCVCGGGRDGGFDVS